MPHGNAISVEEMKPTFLGMHENVHTGKTAYPSDIYA